MTHRRALTDAQAEEACALREAGKTLGAIVRYFARKGVTVSPGSIAWICLRAGADLPVARRQPRMTPAAPVVERRGDFLVRRFTRDEDRQLLALEAAGKSKAEIGRALDRKHNSIIGRLVTLARRDARAEEMPHHPAFHRQPEHEGVVS